MFSRTFRHWIVVLAAFLTAAPAANAEDRYYMMIFAAEGTPNTPRAAHSFATFIKAPQTKKGGKAARLDVHTISWLPAGVEIRLLAPPEKGKNFTLKETLDIEKTQNGKVTAWGPFEIRKELYDRALAQIKRLNSGKIEFKSLDLRFRPDIACNCFHAISDMVPGPLLDTGTAYGEEASRMVLQHLSRFIIQPRQVHRDLAKRLIDGYSITYHDEILVVPVKTLEKK